MLQDDGIPTLDRQIPPHGRTPNIGPSRAGAQSPRMTRLVNSTIPLAAGILLACSPGRPPETLSIASDPETRTLWYADPAVEWTDALPVGNGRLGAMVFGGTQRERIQLNEESIWSGGPIREMNSRTPELIEEARRLLFAGRYVDAEELVNDSILRPGGTRSSHQTLGDLWLDFGEPVAVESYRRELSLDSALAITTYRADGVEIRREVFASARDGVVAVRVECGDPGCPAFEVSLSRPQSGTVEAVEDGVLRMYGRASHAGENPGVRFEARLRATSEGGTVTSSGDALRIEGGQAATLLVAGSSRPGGAFQAGAVLGAALVVAHLAGVRGADLPTHHEHALKDRHRDRDRGRSRRHVRELHGPGPGRERAHAACRKARARRRREEDQGRRPAARPLPRRPGGVAGAGGDALTRLQSERPRQHDRCHLPVWVHMPAQNQETP